MNIQAGGSPFLQILMDCHWSYTKRNLLPVIEDSFYLLVNFCSKLGMAAAIAPEAADKSGLPEPSKLP